MSKNVDVELLDKVRQGLAEQCDMLPEKTLKRLQAIHTSALGSVIPQRRFFKQSILGMPLAPVSLAMTAAVLGVVLLATPDSPLVGNEDDVVNDIDVLMSNEDMEFLENLEMYEWLDAEYG